MIGSSSPGRGSTRTRGFHSLRALMWGVRWSLTTHLLEARLPAHHLKVRITGTRNLVNLVNLFVGVRCSESLVRGVVAAQATANLLHLPHGNTRTPSDPH
eukprot:1007619-Pyramimonas_sp.AAC.1